MEAKRISGDSGKGLDLLTIKLLIMGALVVSASMAGCTAAVVDFPESMGGVWKSSGETGGVEESHGGESEEIDSDQNDSDVDSSTPPESSWEYAESATSETIQSAASAASAPSYSAIIYL